MQISEILFLKVLAHVKEATAGKDMEEKWAYLHVAQKYKLVWFFWEKYVTRAYKICTYFGIANSFLRI